MTKVSSKKEYKSSGIDWLGYIPVDWNLVPTRSLFKTKKQRVGAETEKHLLLGLTLSGVKPRDLSLGGKNPADYNSYQIFEPGELVMCLFDYDVTPRTVGYVKQKGMMTGAYTRLIPRVELDPRYYYYLFLYFDEKKELLHLCTGLRNSISKHIFWSLQNPLPPFEIQKRIADFLDEKTKVIDELVGKKENLIELLREKRTALITHAVTKGVDPKTKMRPSRVDWLGDIPEGWEVRKGKFIFRYKKELNSRYQCDHILALTLRGVINKEDYEARSLTPTDYASYQIFYQDDLVFKLIDLENFQTSRVGIVPEKGIMSPAYLRIVPVVKITPRFFYWFYYSLYLQRIFNFLGMGVRSTLNQHDLLAQSVTLPPIQEQKQIANFLNAETGRIDKAVKLVESQIEKLKEYRSSLIYHAVTGKMKI